MAVPSYLSTFLLAHQLRGAETFAERFAGEWLLWEPGPWQAPSRTGSTLKIDAAARTPQPGNALCFHLGPAKGRTFSVGRDPSSDVLITDGTVSRQQAQLIGEQGTWQVKPLGGHPATLAGVQLPAEGGRLSPGQTLQFGGVALTFHDVASLMKRLAQTT